jgi:dihydroorotase
MDTLTIIRPDDLHLHLRDGPALQSVVADSARQFARAMIMPNLSPPVTTVAQALAYRDRIRGCLPEGSTFEPLMTLYLTDNTPLEEVRAIADSDDVYAVKYYPAGATTNSDRGVTDIKNVYPVLEKMQELKVPLLVHGETTSPDVDTFDREQVFIDRVLTPLLDKFPGLKLVLEHITTEQAVQFVTNAPDTIAATITPQHLLYNRNALFAKGLRPHYYCLPVLKREHHRRAVVGAAVSGHPRFFLGTDSAPHARSAKESACGCAGIYSAHSAIELYAELFETEGKLPHLEQFASINGARFYGLPQNQDTITLEKKDWRIPESLPFADTEIVPLRAGELCHWKLKAL